MAAAAAAPRVRPAEQAGDQKQPDHRDGEAEVGQSELGQQRHGTLATTAQVPTHEDRFVKVHIHQRAAVKAMCRHRVMGALWAVVRPITIRVGDFMGILLDRTNERV